MAVTSIVGYSSALLMFLKVGEYSLTPRYRSFFRHDAGYVQGQVPVVVGSILGLLAQYYFSELTKGQRQDKEFASDKKKGGKKGGLKWMLNALSKFKPWVK